MRLKVIKEDGSWYVVSSIYEPASHGRVGSGVIWCTPHPTRAEARRFMADLRKGEMKC